MAWLPKRGVVTFVFDDGYTHILKNALPLLEKYGFQGVFAIPLDTTTMPEKFKFPISTPQDWKDRVDEQHELAAHGATHRDLSDLSPEELETELATPAQELNASTIVYPGGGYNQQVIDMAKKIYSAGRGVEFGFEALPPKDTFRLRTFNATTNNFQVWKMNLRILWAYITNSWIIETFHILETSPNSDFNHSVDIQKFEEHLRWITQIPVENKTIRDVVGEK